jgi:DinB superfamily
VAPVDARDRRRVTRAERLAALAAFPDGLMAAVAAARGRPIPVGEWGPAEVVRHLIAVETDVHQARLADLATTPSPTWDWAEPGPWPGQPGLSLDALLERFASLRSVTLATLAVLDGAGWARTGTHTRLGVWDVESLVGNAVEHDAEHLAGLG